MLTVGIIRWFIGIRVGMQILKHHRELIGKGGNKEVYSFGDDQVVTVLQDGKPLSSRPNTKLDKKGLYGKKLKVNWNMRNHLNENLLKMLKMGMIKKELFKGRDIDQILDLRDEKIFDEKWMEIYNYLKQFRSEFDGNELITKIRQEAFLNTIRLSGSSELAGYVSDDFELFGNAVELGYDNKWLNGMFHCYITLRFPCGEIENIQESIEMQIKDYLKDM